MSDITKRAISASLKKLLLTKSLNKITIQDITDDCGINRQTFYYHFADIYDLVEWTCIEDTEKVLRKIRLTTPGKKVFWRCSFWLKKIRRL